MDYESKADELIRNYGKFKPSFEEVGKVMESLIKADLKWDGRGDKDRYVISQGIFRIRAIMYKKKISKQNKREINVDTQKYKNTFEYIDPGYNTVMAHDLLPLLKGRDHYTKLYDRFFNKMTLEEIGNKHGITRQRVHQIINRELKYAREQLDDM